MLTNNNQGSVRLLAKRSMKGSRSRNFFTILAIILTTFMFTAVFSIGFSFVENTQKMFLRKQGTDAFLLLNHPTKEQIQQIRKIKLLQAGGIQVHIGELLVGENAFTIDYYDKIEFEQNYTPAISDIEGKYPTATNEIMMSNSALEELGIKRAQIGMNISLDFNGEKQDFRLSGWYQDYETFPSGCHIFVSQKYVEENGYQVETDGKFSMSVKSGKEEDFLNAIGKVSFHEGQELSYPGGSWTKDDSSGQISLVVLMGILVLIIILSGYLLIYNVMYISITRDIRFYGLLKAIGTSPKQIRQMVRKQGFRLAAIGIPTGMLLGTVVSFAAVPLVLQMFASDKAEMPTDIQFHPLIYFGTIAFAILTIAISCHKPARLASRVSPVEAMKYNGLTSIKQKNKKKSLKRQKKQKQRPLQHGGKLYKMAWRNIFREKKRAVLVFASLFMGTMTYLLVQVFLGSMKLENYVDHYLPDDITIFVDRFGEEIDENKIQKEVQKLEKKIKQLKGVTDFQTCQSIEGKLKFDRELYQYFIEQGIQEMGKSSIEPLLQQYENNKEDYTTNMIGIDSKMLERYNKNAKNPVDMERFKQGKVCLIGYVWDDKSAEELLGKTITIESSNVDSSRELEIANVVQGEYGLNLGDYVSSICSPHYILVSQEFLEQLSKERRTDNLILTCEEKFKDSIISQVKSLTEKNPVFSKLKIKADMMEEFQTSMMSLNVVASAFSIILILIGLLNFINVMLTSVYTRRMELAVLESVGMTKKQVGRMLMLEGVYYGTVTMFLIMTIGNIFIYLVAYLSKLTADYAVFYYPWKIMVAIAVGIFLLCSLVPLLIYKTVSLESVTERLHNSE